MVVAAVKPSLQIHHLICNPQLCQGVKHLPCLCEGGHGSHAPILLAQEELGHFHTGQHIAVEFDIVVFLLGGQHALFYQALAHIGGHAHIAGMGRIQEGIADRQGMVIRSRLHNGKIGFVAGGAKHLQCLTAANDKAGIHIIVVVHVPGHSGGDEGQGCAIFDGGQNGGIFLAQGKQPHGAVAGGLQHGKVRRQHINAIYELGIVPHPRTGFPVVETDDGAVCVGNDKIAAAGIVLGAKVAQELNAIDGCAAFFFNTADGHRHIQVIPFQTVLHRNGEGHRNGHRTACQAHLLDAVLLRKSHRCKHGRELLFGVLVVPGRLQQLPHSGDTGICRVIPGKGLGILLGKC